MDDMDIENKSPIVSDSSILGLFEKYGWYILIGIIIFAYLYEKFIKSLINHFKGRYDEAVYAAKYHKNPDLITSRLLDQERKVAMLQEKYNIDAQKYKEKQEEKEQKKRAELLLNVDGGQKLGSKHDSKNASFKPEYNPLMGSGSSSNYRPPKKSACSGGGCG